MLINTVRGGIITSPPYSIALNYVENDEHALKFLQKNPKKCSDSFIGVRGNGKERAKLYQEDMKTAYKEMARVLKPSRMIAIILGNATIDGKAITTVEECEQTFQELGLKKLHKINKIIFGLYNTMQQEDILIF